MARNLNTTTVTNFACIISIAIACDYHVLLPRFFPQYAEEKNLAFLVFYVFYKMTKSVLLRTLELNPPAPPKEPPLEPNVPEFPQKSPLIQL
jgi:hypothetical protein